MRTASIQPDYLNLTSLLSSLAGKFEAINPFLRKTLKYQNLSKGKTKNSQGGALEIGQRVANLFKGEGLLNDAEVTDKYMAIMNDALKGNKLTYIYDNSNDNFVSDGVAQKYNSADLEKLAKYFNKISGDKFDVFEKQIGKNLIRIEVLGNDARNTIVFKDAGVGHSNELSINGVIVEDGGGVVRNANGDLVVHNDEVSLAQHLLALKGAGQKLMLSVNGMNNNAMDAFNLNNSLRQIMQNDIKFNGSSVYIYNSTGPVSIGGDLVNYVTNGEKAQSTLSYLLSKDVISQGDTLIGHSQGADILTQALASLGKDVNTQATLILFGGAHTVLPTSAVNNIIDIRNAFDFIAGSRHPENTPHGSNYKLYHQLDYSIGYNEKGTAINVNTWNWGTGTNFNNYGTGGSGHNYMDNYRNALDWYLRKHY